MFESEADQIVSASGHFLEGKQVLVRNRLQDGDKGYWVVAAFAVDGAPKHNTIPVVRGWQPGPTPPPAPPAGELDLTGRLDAVDEAHRSADPGLVVPLLLAAQSERLEAFGEADVEHVSVVPVAHGTATS